MNDHEDKLLEPSEILRESDSTTVRYHIVADDIQFQLNKNGELALLNPHGSVIRFSLPTAAALLQILQAHLIPEEKETLQ